DAVTIRSSTPGTKAQTAKCDRVADPEVVNYYKKTYTYYSRGFYSQTIISCDEADQRFPDNRLKPKFDFIKAMSIGHQEGESSLLSNLRGVIQDHPNSEVAAEANKIIDYLETGKKEEEARQQAEAEAEAKLQEDLKRYKFDPNSKHDAVLILPNSKDTDINRMRGYISNFNRKYFSTSSLRTTSVLLGTKYHMISIKSFENSKEAMKYYRAFVQNREELKKINGKGHPFFAISFFNSATFYQNEDIDTYQVFFSERYLNETE
ncbi:MAG: hypothetical protein AAGB22_11595, partial [Bacteroidota bacterium]